MNPPRKSISKLLSLILAILLACDNADCSAFLQANAASPAPSAGQPSNIDFSPFAAVRDFYIPENNSSTLSQALSDPERQLVIYIEDAHGIISAQKNLADTIDQITRQADLGHPWIALEGTPSGEIDHRSLTMFPDRNLRTFAADYFVHRGLLDGSVFYAAHYDPAARIFGIDSQSLAGLNLEAYRQFLPIRPRAEESLSHLTEAARILKQKIYQDDLVLLDRISENLLKDPKHLPADLNRLKELSRLHGIDLESYANLDRLLKLRERSEAFPEAAFQAELTAFEKSRRLPALDAAEILRLWRAGPKDFEGYPRLREKAEILEEYAALESGAWTDEMDEWIRDLWNRMLSFQEARDVWRLWQAIAFYRKLFSFSLNAKDYERYATDPSFYSAGTMRQTMQRYSFLLRSPAARPDDGDYEFVESAGTAALRFYGLAQERNALLMKNLLELVRRNPAKKTFLVAGGFHEAELTKAFRENKIAYVILTPRIDKFDGEENYWRILGGENFNLVPRAAASAFELKLPVPLPQYGGEARGGDLGLAPEAALLLVAAAESGSVTADAEVPSAVARYGSDWDQTYGATLPFSRIAGLVSPGSAAGWVRIAQGETGKADLMYFGAADVRAVPPEPYHYTDRLAIESAGQPALAVSRFTDNAPPRSEIRNRKASSRPIRFTVDEETYAWLQTAKPADLNKDTLKKLSPALAGFLKSYLEGNAAVAGSLTPKLSLDRSLLAEMLKETWADMVRTVAGPDGSNAALLRIFKFLSKPGREIQINFGDFDTIMSRSAEGGKITLNVDQRVLGYLASQPGAAELFIALVFSTLLEDILDNKAGIAGIRSNYPRTMERVAQMLLLWMQDKKRLDPRPVQIFASTALAGIAARNPGLTNKDPFFRMLLDRFPSVSANATIAAVVTHVRPGRIEIKEGLTWGAQAGATGAWEGNAPVLLPASANGAVLLGSSPPDGAAATVSRNTKQPSAVDVVRKSPEKEWEDVQALMKRYLTPAELTRFQLNKDSFLGAGAFGSVWLVWDNQIKRKVAMKVIHQREGSNAKGFAAAVERARVEVELLRDLAHYRDPAIPALIEERGLMDGKGEGLIFMNFAEGADLESTAAGRSPEDRAAYFDEDAQAAVNVLRQLLKALNSAHRDGVVHRDLKPANIKINNDGDITLLDWGLGLRYAEDGKFKADNDRKVGGKIVGTLGFIAPETISNSGHLWNGAEDIYAAGALLYYLLTGVRPTLEAEKPKGTGDQPQSVGIMALLIRAQQAVYKKPEAYNEGFREPAPDQKTIHWEGPALGQPLQYIILKAMAYPESEPAPSSAIRRGVLKKDGTLQILNRYASTEEFLADLEAFAAQQPLPSALKDGLKNYDILVLSPESSSTGSQSEGSPASVAAGSSFEVRTDLEKPLLTTVSLNGSIAQLGDSIPDTSGETLAYGKSLEEQLKVAQRRNMTRRFVLLGLTATAALGGALGYFLWPSPLRVALAMKKEELPIRVTDDMKEFLVRINVNGEERVIAVPVPPLSELGYEQQKDVSFEVKTRGKSVTLSVPVIRSQQRPQVTGVPESVYTRNLETADVPILLDGKKTIVRVPLKGRIPEQKDGEYSIQFRVDHAGRVTDQGVVSEPVAVRVIIDTEPYHWDENYFAKIEGFTEPDSGKYTGRIVPLSRLVKEGEIPAGTDVSFLSLYDMQRHEENENTDGLPTFAHFGRKATMEGRFHAKVSWLRVNKYVPITPKAHVEMSAYVGIRTPIQGELSEEQKKAGATPGFRGSGNALFGLWDPDNLAMGPYVDFNGQNGAVYLATEFPFDFEGRVPSDEIRARSTQARKTLPIPLPSGRWTSMTIVKPAANERYTGKTFDGSDFSETFDGKSGVLLLDGKIVPIAEEGGKKVFVFPMLTGLRLMPAIYTSGDKDGARFGGLRVDVKEPGARAGQYDEAFSRRALFRRSGREASLAARSELRLENGPATPAAKTIEHAAASAMSSEENALIVLPLRLIGAFLDNFLPLNNTNILFLDEPGSGDDGLKETYKNRLKIYHAAIIPWPDAFDRIQAGKSDIENLKKRAAQAFGLSARALGRPVFLGTSAFESQTAARGVLPSSDAVFIQAVEAPLLKDDDYRMAHLLVAATLSKEPGVILFGLSVNADGSISLGASLLAEFAHYAQVIKDFVTSA